MIPGRGDLDASATPDGPDVVLLPGTTARLIARTVRVPGVDGPPGNATVLVRQLDVALLPEGFVAPARLLAHLAGLDPDAVRPHIEGILGAVRRRHAPIPPTRRGDRGRVIIVVGDAAVVRHRTGP